MHRHALPMHDLATSDQVRHTAARHRGGNVRAKRARVGAIAALAIVLPTSVAAASAATAATTPAPTPAPIANAATTGVPTGVKLTTMAPGKITAAGTVIDGKDISGTVTIAAANVTIKNSRIHGSSGTAYGIRVESGSVTVVDSEITGFQYAIGGSNWTAQRVDISGTSVDGVKLGSGVSLLDSWVHGLGVSGGGSVDGAQLDATATNVLLRGNTIDVTGANPANSAIFLKPSGSTTAGGPLTIDNNWIDGGTSTLQVLKSSTGGAEAGVKVTGNHFGRHGGSASRITAPATASGNVWADTGAAITLSGATNVAAPAPTTPPATTTPTTPPATTTPTPPPATTTPPAPTTPPATTTPTPPPATTTPTPPATTTPPVAPSGAKPGATNTGVPAGKTLTASGSITVTAANTVIDGKAVNGTITVAAPGVVIKNTKITGSGSYGIKVNSGDVTIQDTEISGFQNAIYGNNWTGLRMNIHGTTQDGVKLGSHVLMQDCWIHDLTPEAGAHADGAQLQSGTTDTVVRHNVIDSSNSASGTLGNSAIIVKPDFGSTSNGPVLIENNWLNGGNYTLYVVPGSTGNIINNVTVRNNHFGDTHRYGYAQIQFSITSSGNVIDSTGKAIL